MGPEWKCCEINQNVGSEGPNLALLEHEGCEEGLDVGLWGLVWGTGLGSPRWAALCPQHSSQREFGLNLCGEEEEEEGQTTALMGQTVPGLLLLLRKRFSGKIEARAGQASCCPLSPRGGHQTDQPWVSPLVQGVLLPAPACPSGANSSLS